MIQFDLEFEDNQASTLDPQTTVWVVYTPAAEPLPTDDDSLMQAVQECIAENERFLEQQKRHNEIRVKAGLTPEDLSLDIPVASAESIKEGRLRYNSDLPAAIEHAAFRQQSSALKLAEYLENPDRPVQVIQLPSSAVTSKIDLYERHIARGYRPFTVLMMDGGIFEYWGYASPWEWSVHTIDELSYSVRDSEQMSGTFWGMHSTDAIEKAEAEWEKLFSQGIFKNPLRKDDID
nr:hypothetical protein [uncultured Dyadobacter sp.]